MKNKADSTAGFGSYRKAGQTRRAQVRDSPSGILENCSRNCGGAGAAWSKRRK